MRGISIKRGDACTLPIRVTLNGQTLAAEDIEQAEVCIGDVMCFMYPGVLRFEDGHFMLPLTQGQTQALAAGRAYPVDIRVMFSGGGVLGTADPPLLSVAETISERKLISMTVHEEYQEVVSSASAPPTYGTV